MLLIAPLILNINFNYYIAEFPIYNPEDNSYTYKNNKIKFSSFNEKQNPTVNIFKRLGHYDLCYTNSFLEEYQEYMFGFKYTEANYEKLISKETGYSIKEEILKCDECHEDQTIRIKFPDLNGIICRDCAIYYVTEILEQRVKYFLSEKYFNLECKFM